VVIEESTQYGGDGTVLMVTAGGPMDDVDVVKWNFTSQCPVLLVRASGRQDNRCGRGLTAKIHYATVGK